MKKVVGIKLSKFFLKLKSVILFERGKGQGYFFFEESNGVDIKLRIKIDSFFFFFLPDILCIRQYTAAEQ